MEEAKKIEMKWYYICDGGNNIDVVHPTELKDDDKVLFWAYAEIWWSFEREYGLYFEPSKIKKIFKAYETMWLRKHEGFKNVKRINYDTQEERMSDAIETELKRYIDENSVFTGENISLDIARHFVQWHKEQMVNKAIEGRYDCNECDNTSSWITFNGWVKPLSKVGEKVKVIILKED